MLEPRWPDIDNISNNPAPPGPAFLVMRVPRKMIHLVCKPCSMQRAFNFFWPLFGQLSITSLRRSLSSPPIPPPGHRPLALGSRPVTPIPSPGPRPRPKRHQEECKGSGSPKYLPMGAARGLYTLATGAFVAASSHPMDLRFFMRLVIGASLIPPHKRTQYDECRRYRWRSPK